MKNYTKLAIGGFISIFAAVSFAIAPIYLGLSVGLHVGVLLTSLINNSITAAPNSGAGGSNPTQVQILLSPNATFPNPNQNEWDNPTSPLKQPSPKDSFPLDLTSTDNKPTNDPDLVADVGICNSKEYNLDTYQASSKHLVFPYYSDSPSPCQSISARAHDLGYDVGVDGVTASTNQYFDNAVQKWVYISTFVKPTTPKACKTGYTRQNVIVNNQFVPTCVLNTAKENIKKPASTPCQSLVNSGTQTFTLDDKNDNCVNPSKIKPSNDAKTLELVTDNGATINLSQNTDGGFRIQELDSSGGIARTIQTGPYSGGDGGDYTIISDTGSGTSTGSASGTGTGSGSGSGSGTGSCGGAGQPSCSIDDSGLNGQSLSTATQEAGVDTAYASILSAIQSNLPSTPSWSWVMPISNVQCAPINSTFKYYTLSIDWCAKVVPLIHAIVSFLAYLFTALYLFNLAFKSNNRID